MPNKLSRREFLAASAAAAAAPAIIPASALGKGGRQAPSERVTMGFIGVGGMGMSNLGGFIGFPDVQVVAVCDVESSVTTKAGGQQFGRDKAKEVVEKKYAEQKRGDFKGCDTYKDFRELCARKDIQAVCVATPDHWHFLASVEAVRNGKDVYCEKPVTHHFKEGLILQDEVKKRNAIWQTGSQQRSEWNFRRGAEIVRNGLIGKVQHVEVGLPTGHQKPQADPKIVDPPETVDYDFWCGPSPKLPFTYARFRFHWRWNLAYGGGQLMDWIGHHNDIAHWGLGQDLGGPVEVEAAGFEYAKDIFELYDSPWAYEVKCTYEGGITSSISNRHKMGTKWIGTDGWVWVDRGKQDASKKEWFDRGFDPGPVKLYESTNHRRNFIDGVRSRKPAICPVEVSFRSITPGFLGYASQALGRKVKWDPRNQKFVDDAAAEKLFDVKYRDPWKLA
jgi:predicted dehydrogenase